MRSWILLIFACFTVTVAAQGQASGVVGDWQEPTGSVIEIFPCGAEVCARMVAVSKQAPSPLDIHNPAPNARKRPLCGLQIGYGFHLNDPAHADGGKLYDPKTGRTYHGSMMAEGDQLHLRGYVGIKAFGRSETWARTNRNAATCPK